VLNDVTIANNSSFGLRLLRDANGTLGSTTVSNAIFENNTQHIVIADDQSLFVDSVSID
jgi:hypothetical protein